MSGVSDSPTEQMQSLLDKELGVTSILRLPQL